MMDSEAMRMGNVSNDADGEKLLVNHRRGGVKHLIDAKPTS
jgi:hypothetical protein